MKLLQKASTPLILNRCLHNNVTVRKYITKNNKVLQRKKNKIDEKRTSSLVSKIALKDVDLSVAPTSNVEVNVYIRIAVKESKGKKASIRFVDDDTGNVSDKIDLTSIPMIPVQNEKDTYTYVGKITIKQEIAKIGAVYFELEEEGDRIFLNSLELRNDQVGAQTQFLCKSWVDYTQGPRIFFDDAYLTHKTPKGLLRHRKAELELIKGDGTGERGGADRIYDYDYYNDLSYEYTKDKPDPSLRRPVIGGKKHPYPRRYRTGRPLNPDNVTESIVAEPFVPLDNRFSSAKDNEIKSRQNLANIRLAENFIKTLMLGCSYENFTEIKDIDASYIEEDSPKEEDGGFFSGLIQDIVEYLNPIEAMKKFFRFPYPLVYNPSRRDNWKTDVEFGRQVITGLHPSLIEGMTEIPKSKLGPEYGSPKSVLTPETIDPELLEGKTLKEAMEERKMFMLDHYDFMMPFVERINQGEGVFTYAPRAFFYLNSENRLMPVAIELCLPSEKRIYTPKSPGYDWQFAKAYFKSVDFTIHEAYTHNCKAHTSTEPYVIATYRCFSAAHPLYRLLLPSFKDTLQINSLERTALFNANGVLDQFFLADKCGIEMSSAIYKQRWAFKNEALPEDLIHRKIATRDKKTGKLSLYLPDYPQAVDGLLHWEAIKSWCTEYCNYYYKDKNDIANDAELQEWWSEIRTKGHPDVDDDVWPSLNTVEDLVQILCTILWICGPYHATVNFSQYDYGGYMPNLPSRTRIPFPDQKIEDEKEFEKIFLQVAPSPFVSFMAMNVGYIFSYHVTDELYVGDELQGWYVNPDIKKMYLDFSKKIDMVGKQIEDNNKNSNYPSRCGKDAIPYTYLLPKSESGITGCGVPTSIVL